MGRFDKKEPKLNEVKAALQRLQGFPEDPVPAGAQPASGGAQPSRRKGRIIAAVVLLQAAAVVGAAYLFANLTTPDVPQSAAVETPEPIKSETVKSALAAARGLMSKGQVRAAREQLLVLATKGSPDAAWDVARSYDPTVLAKIPQADAAADIAEATRWYHTWYDGAVKEGMVANSVSLERIITSMQKAANPTHQ
jgi:hypothetical protein